MDKLDARIRIDAAHPALPGHFPGGAVVPGVVLLDRVAALLETAGHGRLKRIAQAKFLRPLLPGEDAELICEANGKNIHFRIMRSAETIASGVLETAPEAA